MVLTIGTRDELSAATFSKLGIYRHVVFVEKLGWQLETDGVIEVDQFDRPDTIYVIGEDYNGNIVCCARLLPTTQPYLLESVFPDLLNGLPPPCTPDVWEITRFAVMNVDGQSSAKGNSTSDLSVQLLEACKKSAAERGAKRLICIISLVGERILSKNNFKFHRAGPPKIVDGSNPVVACWLDYK